MALGRRSVIFLVVAMATSLLGCAGSQAARSPTSQSPSPGMIARTISLVDGTIVVPAGSSHDAHVEVDEGTMSNAHIAGWFHASGGSQSEIEVFLVTDSDYQTWTQGRRVTPLYTSGRTTYANINVQVPASYETYHLVFNNVFSTSLKTVQAEIDLDYYVPASPTPTP